MAVAALQSSLFTDEQEAVVHYTDVYKRFGSKVVLDGLTLDVRRGEALALLGRSGTGKSVTLKLLIGLLRPDKGKVRVGGADLDDMNERDLTRMRRHIGMVFQGGALFDSMSVKENVAYGLREHFRFAESKIAERVRECLSLVGLEENVEKLEPGALSGGMRKRVAIARAIATWPELLLYDEPTAGLDPATTNQVNSLIVSLKQRLGVTSIIVTHDMPSAFYVADRLALLEKGRIVWSGDTAEAREAPPAPLARFLDTDTEEDAWTSLES